MTGMRRAENCKLCGNPINPHYFRRLYCCEECKAKALREQRRIGELNCYYRQRNRKQHQLAKELVTLVSEQLAGEDLEIVIELVLDRYWLRAYSKGEVNGNGAS